MATTLEHWKKFRPSDLTVREFEHWLVVVRAKQVTLGSTVFLLKRPVEALGGLEATEAAELPSVAGWFEERVRNLYTAERFNYVAAMMKDPYVHFHAFPRYGSQRERYGMGWSDDAWPKVIEFRDVDTPDNVLFAIRDDLAV